MPNPIETFLRRHIEASGPLNLDAFMHICLHHDTDGYYTLGQGIGRKGDFITAPEISPLYGQALARWVRDQWTELGCPQAWRLVELGPGCGTLMADMLPCLPVKPSDLLMVEASLALQNHSRERLSQRLSFVSNLGMLPRSDLPTLFIGNEYLDALPIRQFQRCDGQVHETCVALSDDDAGFCFAVKPASNRLCPLPNNQDGFWEVSQAAQAHLTFVVAEVQTNGGGALFIDYGYETLPGVPTFQALKNHEKVHPLQQPGTADLTALVDFGTLAALVHARGLRPRLESQQDLLQRLGIADLLDANPKQATSVARLVRDDAMGSLFKALSFSASRL